MATCRTCGAEIPVPDGWKVGPAVRKHYWSEHAQKMEQKRADRNAEASIPPQPKGGTVTRPEAP